MLKPSQTLESGDVLLAVDVQRDFCPGGALAVPEGDRVIPLLNRWIRHACESGATVYASCDWHPRRHASFQSEGGPWPPHCVQGTAGAEFHPELALPTDAILVAKGTRLDRDQLSAFDETGLAVRLARDGVKRVWIGGLALDVCVRATVLQALGEDFAVHLIVDATRPLSAERGAEALREMREAGAVLEESA